MLCFVLISTSLLLKKCLAAPIKDLAFPIKALALASSLSLKVIVEPMNFKLCVNWMCWLSGKGLITTYMHQHTQSIEVVSENRC